MFFHKAFRGSAALTAPWFQTLESRVVRELISIVLSYQVCGTLLWQPKKINTPLLCSFAEKWVHEEVFQNIRESRQSTMEVAGSAPHRNRPFLPKSSIETESIHRKKVSVIYLSLL